MTDTNMLVGGRWRPARGQGPRGRLSGVGLAGRIPQAVANPGYFSGGK